MFRGRIIHTASGVAFGGKGYISFNKTTLHKYYTKEILNQMLILTLIVMVMLLSMLLVILLVMLLLMLLLMLMAIQIRCYY